MAFSVNNPWFHVMKLPAISHVPMLEVPDLVAALVCLGMTALLYRDISSIGRLSREHGLGTR